MSELRPGRHERRGRHEAAMARPVHVRAPRWLIDQMARGVLTPEEVKARIGQRAERR